jgi:predicted esterase
MRLYLALLVVASSIVSAQAAPNTTLALIGYNALKNRINPQGELGAQIASLDTLIRQASRNGQTAQVRRWIAKGTALMNGRVWADTSDYRQSLVLRTEHVVVDPSILFPVRLEQTYAPSIEGLSWLRAEFRVDPLPGTGWAGAIASTTDVSRDLRDTPARIEFPLSGAPNGDYQMVVTVADSSRTLGVARLRFTVVAGLNARLSALDAASAKAPAEVVADLRYPGDFIRKVDRGAVALTGFDVARELTAAESIATAAKKGKNPFAGRTGNFERHHLLASVNEVMPYRVHVPASYDGKKAMPLIIALHGAGGTEDGFMDGYNKLVPQLAEQRGYIVATPMGLRVDAGYGSPIMNAGKNSAPSEEDVMAVLGLMVKNYKIDDKRVYLMGHSMGGIGTWHLGAKYPEIWAALGSFSGMGFPASVVRMKAIPQFVVHGDNDNTVPVQRSRDMVAEFQKLGMDYKYTEVPGGDHDGVVVPNLAALFDFFDTKRKP